MSKVTGTAVQFNTALSDDNFAYIGQANVFTQNQEIEKTGAIPILTFDRPEVLVDNTTIARINFSGFDDASATEVYAQIRVVVASDAAANPDGCLDLRVDEAGTLTNYITLNDLAGGDIDLRRPVNFNSQNVSNMGILQFVDANQTIANNAGNLFYDVAIGQVHLWRINNVTEMQLSATALDLKNNTLIVGTGAVLITGGTMRIPLSATPIMAVDGDFAIDTTITDFSMGLIKYFDGEEMAVISVPIAQLTTPTDGHVVTYDAAADEFQLKAGGGGSQTPWTATIDAADFSLTNLDILNFNERTDAATATAAEIYWNAASGMSINVPGGDSILLKFNGVTRENHTANFISYVDLFTLQWVTVNRRIRNTGAGFLFGVETGDKFSYEIQGILELELSATTLDLKTNNLILGIGSDIILATTTGTKIGTGTTQLLAFWNATPVVQPGHIADPTGGSVIDIEARAAIDSILAQLATTGMQAAT